jgi:hypothetical protein
MVMFGAGTLLAQSQNRVNLGYFANGLFGEYRVQTSLVVQNQEATEATLQLRFRHMNGAPMEGLAIQGRAQKGRQHRAGQNGEVQGLSIPPGAYRNFESTGEGPLEIGSCSVDSPARIRAYSRVRLFDAEGLLVSEVNILPSGSFRGGGFFMGDMDPADIGISLTNTSAESTAVCLLQLFETVEGAGNDVPLLEGDGVTLTLGGDAQTTRMLKELFEEQYETTLKEFLADPETGDVYAIVTCDNPICAVVLHLNGLEYLGIPVNPESPDE